MVKEKSDSTYSKGTPSLSFQTAVEYIPEIAAHGIEGTFDALSDVMESGVNDGYFRKKLQTEGKFELMEYDIQEKTYKLTPLAIRIAHPISEQHKIYSIQQAFLNHPIVNQIYEASAGNNVSQNIGYFANFISAKCNIPPQYKDIWAKYFLSGARFCGIVRTRSNGDEYIVSKIVAPGDSGDEVSKSTENEPPNNKQRVSTKDEGEGSKFIKGEFAEMLHIPVSGDRTLYVYIPGNLTATDIKRVTIKLQSVIAGLEAYSIETG